jgi:hypothetical protein
MEQPVVTLLRIVQETSTTYRVLYLRRSPSGTTAAMPWHIAGHATLRRFLQQFETLGDIELLLTRVATGSAHVFDLSAMDDERVARLLRPYMPGHSSSLAQRDPRCVC